MSFKKAVEKMAGLGLDSIGEELAEHLGVIYNSVRKIKYMVQLIDKEIYDYEMTAAAGHCDKKGQERLQIAADTLKSFRTKLVKIQLNQEGYTGLKDERSESDKSQSDVE